MIQITILVQRRSRTKTVDASAAELHGARSSPSADDFTIHELQFLLAGYSG